MKAAASLFLIGSVAWAQVPDAPVPAQPPAAPASGASSPGSFLGKDVPVLDPGSEVLSWDGKNWNIANNRLFQARFEKYLNAPEETGAEAEQYRAIISEIMNRLAPGYASTQNVDYSFRLLHRGSNYDIDARLCDALANAVYTVWTAQRQQQRLVKANEAMQYEIMQLEAATRHQSTVSRDAEESREKMKTPKGGKNAQQTAPATAPAQAAEVKQAAIDGGNWQTRRLTEMVARQKANDLKRELSEIAAKVEFQALMVQFFLQRRYQHVIISTRFYRALFNDGDSKLNLGKDANELFQRSTGQPPTVSVLDSMASEAIRDVREGVKAFEFLLENNELDSASKRLSEAFAVGEYMPEIRTLKREKKRRVVDFSHKAFQLVSAIEVKDYTLAESLVKDLAANARDFDSSKPLAAIETARTVARMQISKARNAAISGDKPGLEAALTEATKTWPRNPELAEVSKMIFSRGDVQEQAVIEFGQLLAQKNYRRIADDSGRFIAALATLPDRRDQLQEVLGHMKEIEIATMRADEMARQSNFAGAWESVEKAFAKFPDDSKLNQLRANLTTQAAEFVRTLRMAQDLEKQDQVGASLAWFLKAQRLYPQSEFAGEGVGRLGKRILP